ncbi:hypothetical protein JCM8547_006871 [Rhodosporidiobolus lusitaniae]
MQLKYPSTLSSLAGNYYNGLTDRLKTNLLPVLEPYVLAASSSSSSSSPLILELASGNGTHAALYAKTWPGVTVQPTECDAVMCGEVDATVKREGVEEKEGEGGVRKAVVLDVVEEEGWEEVRRALRSRRKGKGKGKGKGKEGEEEEGEEKEAFDLVLGSNFLHMVPFPGGPLSIFSHLLASQNPPLLSPSARLLIYGPFKSDSDFFSEADEAFDNSIRSRPGGDYFGLRSIDALERLTRENGWDLEEMVGMPKGNWVLVFKQQGGP